MWRSTLKEAGLVGGDVDYLEAHGQGTILGDYVEMTAIAGTLWGEKRSQLSSYCWICES